MSASAAIENAFEAHRRYLWALAYRMLGDPDEARDLVQEAYVRALEREPDVERSLRPWLAKVTANLAIDRLRRRKAQAYDGPWLPVPVEELEVGDGAQGPEARYGLRESASLAFLYALEALDARTRAVLLLREVFGYTAAEVGEMLELSAENVRVLSHRARKALDRHDARRPTAVAMPELLARLNAALMADDASALEALLVEDARVATDAAGRYRANRKVVAGRVTVAAFLRGLARKNMPRSMDLLEIGGQAFVHAIYDPPTERDTPEAWIGLELDGDQILGVYTISAPDKVAAVMRWRDA